MITGNPPRRCYLSCHAFHTSLKSSRIVTLLHENHQQYSSFAKDTGRSHLSVFLPCTPPSRIVLLLATSPRHFIAFLPACPTIVKSHQNCQTLEFLLVFCPYSWAFSIVLCQGASVTSFTFLIIHLSHRIFLYRDLLFTLRFFLSFNTIFIRYA